MITNATVLRLLLCLQFLKISWFQSERVIFSIVNIPNRNSTGHTCRLDTVFRFWRVWLKRFTTFHLHRCCLLCGNGCGSWSWHRNRTGRFIARICLWIFKKDRFVERICFFLGFHFFDASDKVRFWGVTRFWFFCVDSARARIRLHRAHFVGNFSTLLGPKTYRRSRFCWLAGLLFCCCFGGCLLKLRPVICEAHACLEIGLI